ncbi:MAG: ammonium transporter, Amt family [Clostridiales bacterium]|nr:ammonium transporter, Amt family [Clostridiales bacterium]
MYSSASTMWVLIAAALVFFMQAGFAMVEAGFTRAKNAGNIIMKNLMDFAIGTPAFWILGFGVMFGTGSAFFGTFDPMVLGEYGLPDGVPLEAFLIFQTVFCATAATIVSGAMAERTKFISYIIYSFFISAVVYPISGHWIWGGGWLAEMGFHDFAGSTVVHMVGGVAALVGAKILGPRIGKYSADGKPKAILGHNLPMGALGVFILWFGWFGFNGGSTVAFADDGAIVSASTIFVTTNLAAAMAAFTTMIVTWFRYKKPDVSMTLNGALAGLVAITAGCDAVSPAGAALIGIIAGVVIVFGIEFVDKILKIDDPVGAIGVHGICGALGTLLVGVFALDGGLVYGGGAGLFITQLIGVVSVALWVVVTMSILFMIIKSTIGLRVSEAEEIVGLDVYEHGLASAYADFTPMISTISAAAAAGAEYPLGEVPEELAIPVKRRDDVSKHPDAKISKVVMIIRPDKFEGLKNAMHKIGITGMTMTQVLGCGMQKGSTEFYRGVPVDITLLPKVKVECVICKVPVELAIKTAIDSLYTGNIGDGKIFVYDVEEVVKVRTGERGYDALQDE